jgi:hypothetical protein
MLLVNVLIFKFSELSVKERIKKVRISSRGSRFWIYFISFIFNFLQRNFRMGRHENKEKRLVYFGLRILLPIQIQWQEIEHPENQKIDFPYNVELCSLSDKEVRFFVPDKISRYIVR